MVTYKDDSFYGPMQHEATPQASSFLPVKTEETVVNQTYDDEGHGDNRLILEQDRFLPIANISRLMKSVLPRTGKVAKDAKECIQECVSEFISFLTAEASERCNIEQRKTIAGEDLLIALSTLGFEHYVDPLSEYVKKYREANKSERSNEFCPNETCSSLTGPSGSAKAAETRSAITVPSNIFSVSKSTGVTGTSSQPIVIEDASGQLARATSTNDLQQLQLLVDPSTGQHYLNVQASSGIQLLPVQVAQVATPSAEQAGSNFNVSNISTQNVIPSQSEQLQLQQTPVQQMSYSNLHFSELNGKNSEAKNSNANKCDVTDYIPY